jgi:hypothetical protein
MAHSWQDLFITGNGAGSAPQEEPQEKRQGFLRRLRENL